MHLYRLACMKRIINIDWGSLEPCLTTHMCIQTTLFWIPFSVCSVFYYALKYIKTEKKSQCLITHRGSYVFSYSRRSFVCATSAQCSLFSSFCCRRITFLAMHCALCMCSTTSTERRANTNSFTCSFTTFYKNRNMVFLYISSISEHYHRLFFDFYFFVWLTEIHLERSLCLYSVFGFVCYLMKTKT